MIDPPALVRGARIGVLGGSFNPAHEGHVEITEAARRACGLDRVWWLVTPGNPLKRQGSYAPLATRLAHAKALTAGRAWLNVSDAEARWGTRYTVDTLGHIQRRYPATGFVWIMGADSLASFHRWRDWRTIMEMMPICVVRRPGQDLNALTSPAARAYAAARVPLGHAPQLATQSAPAWLYLPTVHNTASSTALRQSGQGL